MTGRARGRSRGRGRSGPPSEARRPGGDDSGASRGRSRGAAPPAQATAPPPAQASAPPPAAAAAPPTQAMAQMTVSEGGRPERRRMNRYQEIECRPQWCSDKRGTSGKPLQLVSNYFKLNSSNLDGMVYQYNVSYSPEVDNKKVRVAMINGQGELLGKPRAFDGMVLFMPRKLPETVTKVVTHRKSDDAPVEITITLTNEIPHNSPSCLQLYNIIFRRILSMMDMKQIQRHYFKPDSPIPIPKHHLELWPGFITSILQYEQNIMLCCEVSHKVLRKETVLEFLYDLQEKLDKRRFYDEATKKVVGEIVLTRYNNKTYRVDDINWDGHPNDSFQLYDGSSITYAEYYKKQYNKVIQDPHQPLLVTKPKKKFGPGGQKMDDRPILLLPELCYMTGLSDEMRSDFHLMKDLATHTRVGPQERNDSLAKFMSDMKANTQCEEELSGWGLKFDSQLLNMDGRVLPPEAIKHKEGGKTYNYKPAEAEWSREMRGMPLRSTVPLDTWMVLFTTRDSGIAHDFLQTLQRVCGPMGINVSKPMMCELRDDKTETYLRTMQEKMTDSVRMVTCILPTNRKDRYDAIKKFCCVSRPVSSQVIVARTLSKKQMLMSVCTKIGIQLNCKLGGEVWAVDIPLKNLMVIGIDCYHDSLSKGKSISGFVASMNQSLTKYYSRCTSQHTGQELVDGIKVCVTGALRKYNEVNKTLPDRIIVFRDGVGDGQLAAVFEHEVKQFMECFKTVGFQAPPKFGFVVVKKRINSRFFMKNGRLQNPPPGSVVDQYVTRKEWYDFFLVSQSVRQGTVTPTHYNVIHDTTGLKPDHMQRLTYKLTHLYYNWPGTIRVPAPCQYAHKLAYLVGTSVHDEPDISLADRLYYL
ncbi:piwi-like protein 1 [Dendronephthya gigantea]|uniref:piwi-like protein 1 n=1 Tax=Dendronephthya gigantea TaxID=151771 RepID=UPI00106DBB58|nr:piwi-like protein 1 [Dendronephthya gigantea]